MKKNDGQLKLHKCSLEPKTSKSQVTSLYMYMYISVLDSKKNEKKKRKKPQNKTDTF